MKLRQPSLGTKAAIFLPFLISCTRAHFRIAELGCLASIPLRVQAKVRQPISLYFKERESSTGGTHIFSSTMPFACEAPWKGFFHSFPR